MKAENQKRFTPPPHETSVFVGEVIMEEVEKGPETLKTAAKRTSLAIALAIILTGEVISPGSANDVISVPMTPNGYSICYGGVCRWGEGDPPNPHIRTVPSRGDALESETLDREWKARCKPAIVWDNLGVARYIYAKAGCEYGNGR